MKIGMIGLGRMGANMALRLIDAGHEVVAFNLRPGKLEPLGKEGAIGATSLDELVRGWSATAPTAAPNYRGAAPPPRARPGAGLRRLGDVRRLAAA